MEFRRVLFRSGVAQPGSAPALGAGGRLKSFLRFTSTFKVFNNLGNLLFAQRQPSRLNTRGFTVLPRSTHEIGRPWPSSETTRGNGRGRDVSAAAIKATCARVAP